MIWVFLGRNLKIISLYLTSAPSNFSNCKISWKKKMPELVNKNALFRYFWVRVLKNYCLIWISTLKIFQLQNFAKEQKCLICDQKCLICFFGGINLKKLFSYLKSAPSNLSHCKILQKSKNSNFRTKNALFGYFWARVFKNHSHVWNQHPQMCQKWIL